MWKWIISPTGRKAAAIMVIVIGSLLIARWYGNKQWAKGESEGRQFVADQLIREKEKEWAARERQIAETKAMLEEQTLILNHATTEIINARAQLRDQYTALTARETVRREADEKIITAVPDSELRAAIRAISAELAGIGTAND